MNDRNPWFELGRFALPLLGLSRATLLAAAALFLAGGGNDRNRSFELGRFAFAPLVSLRPGLLAAGALVLAGGVNDRNPSLDFGRFALPPARLLAFDRPDAGRFGAFAVRSAGGAGVSTRASRGDIVGAWYCPPAERAATTERPLKSAGRAVAAIAGRPRFTDAKFCRS